MSLHKAFYATGSEAVRHEQRRYDMNGRSQMQGSKNWILPKEINANRFFWEYHRLEIWNYLLMYLLFIWGGTKWFWGGTIHNEGHFRGGGLKIETFLDHGTSVASAILAQKSLSRIILKLISWTYNFVEISVHTLESSQIWDFRIQCSNYKLVSNHCNWAGGGGAAE